MWRKANLRDMEMVLRWRNDPHTRANSLDQREIGAEEHAAWFAHALASPRMEIWIYVNDGCDCGMLRLEHIGSSGMLRLEHLGSSGEWNVHIMVAPEWRNAGIGTMMLTDMPGGRKGEKRVYRALVKPDNVPSVLAFIKAGFRFETLLSSTYCLVRQENGRDPAKGA